MNINNHGGARPGAGRPRKNKEYSDEFKEGILKTLEAKEKETGKSVFYVFADMLYDKSVKDTVKVALFRILFDVMVEKESQTTEIKKYPRVVILPATKEMPQEFKDKEKQFKKKLVH